MSLKKTDKGAIFGVLFFILIILVQQLIQNGFFEPEYTPFKSMTPCQQTRWSDVTPSHGHFSLMLPCTPNESSEQINLAQTNGAFAYENATRLSNGDEYGVIFVDLEPIFRDAPNGKRPDEADFLWGARKALVREDKATLLSKRIVYISGVESRAYEVRYNTGRHAFFRLSLHNDGIFLWLVHTEHRSEPSEQDLEFLTSFTFSDIKKRTKKTDETSTETAGENTVAAPVPYQPRKKKTLEDILRDRKAGDAIKKQRQQEDEQRRKRFQKQQENYLLQHKDKSYNKLFNKVK